ncbi:MAG: D-alanyl-D-alanine carboxypeptidase/D-alanyl-D-alanine-endopeptidase [Candidatus Omnitrophica bacterium]|nr:D-alanyl-D-alanine carboxypeptidase/D-alanyl-D-alanine-endopeptidase [Candidatus Omnitrophota bacterium]
MYHFFSMRSIFKSIKKSLLQTFALSALLVPIIAATTVRDGAWAVTDSDFARIFRPEESWSVVIADAQNGRVVYRQNPQTPRMPASNLKVYVTAAAFDLLGSHYRYRTPFLVRGKLSPQGVLVGDLLVRGSGDPTFSGRFEEDSKDVTARFSRWADRMKELHIRTVKGNLYGDDSIFDKNYWGREWPEDEYCNWYTAPSGGLILNDSCLDIGVFPGTAVGSPPRIETIPDTKYLRIENNARTIARGQKNGVSFRRPFDSNDLAMYGKVAADSRGTQHVVALTDPTGYFVNVLKETLEKEGIEILGEAKDAREEPDLPRHGWKVLTIENSPPLKELAKVINTRSQNLFADSLLKTLGAKKAGMGNWAGGSMAVREWVREQGLPVEHLHLEDGSGLSRLNRVTAETTCDLLHHIQKKPWFPLWKETLAVSGEYPGSLRNRLKTSTLKGKVRAKTGYIDDVYCLSGYVEAKSGKEYVFSLLFNGKSHAGKHPHHRMEEALTLVAREEP